MTHAGALRKVVANVEGPYGHKTIKIWIPKTSTK